MKNDKQTENIQNLEFAKAFFQIMDLNGTGTLSLDEISIPHITLGVSSDTNFIKMVLRNINPKKFSNDEDFKNNRLTLKEFCNVFMKDVVEERLTETLVSLAIQQKPTEG